MIRRREIRKEKREGTEEERNIRRQKRKCRYIY
jgi:hypothetical protein